MTKRGKRGCINQCMALEGPDDQQSTVGRPGEAMVGRPSRAAGPAGHYASSDLHDRKGKLRAVGGVFEHREAVATWGKGEGLHEAEALTNDVAGTGSERPGAELDARGWWLECGALLPAECQGPQSLISAASSQQHAMRMLLKILDRKPHSVPDSEGSARAGLDEMLIRWCRKKRGSVRTVAEGG